MSLTYPKNTPTKQQCTDIVNKFTSEYTNDSFVACSAAFGWQGYTIILLDYQKLKIYKLTKTTSNSQNITADQLKQKCFMWVYDSKSMTDANERKEILYDKLANRLTGFNVSIFIAYNQSAFSVKNAKAFCQFSKKDYGHHIVIVVN